MPPGIHDHGAPTRRGARSENAAAEFTYSARWSRIGRAHRRGGRCGHAKSTVRCGVWRDAMIRLRVNARSCAGEFAYVVHSEHRQCRPVLCDCLSTCSDDLFEKRTVNRFTRGTKSQTLECTDSDASNQNTTRRTARPAHVWCTKNPANAPRAARTAQSPHSFSSASIITTELPRMTTIPTLFCSLAETCGK